MNTKLRLLGKRPWIGVSIAAVLLALPPLLSGQEFTLDNSEIIMVDGATAAGDFSLTSTIGLLDPANVSSGSFTLEGSIALVAPSARPVLDIALVGNQVGVSWSASFADFVLDETSSLAGIINWSPVLPPYVTNATQISITVPLLSGQRFYRLRRP